jgi:hypothetical protein
MELQDEMEVSVFGGWRDVAQSLCMEDAGGIHRQVRLLLKQPLVRLNLVEGNRFFQLGRLALGDSSTSLCLRTTQNSDLEAT